MQARFDLAKSKGCDGIDADNISNYQEKKHRFEFNAEDQLAYQTSGMSPASITSTVCPSASKRPRAGAGTVGYFDWSLMRGLRSL
jgi:hypothetical protein